MFSDATAVRNIVRTEPPRGAANPTTARGRSSDAVDPRASALPLKRAC